MFSHVMLMLVAGCLTSAESNNVVERNSGASNATCLKTIISSNGDTTKFSFELNHQAAKVIHCQSLPGETESWTIEPLSSDDVVQPLNINTGRYSTNEGSGLSNANKELHVKIDVLVQTVAKLEKEISSTPRVMNGYRKIGNLSGLYRMHPFGKTWAQAKFTCEQEGSNLLIINNADEVNVVPTLFSLNPIIESARFPDLAWIGAHDVVNEGEFMTVLGERLSSIGYANWNPGHPLTTRAYNCVHVDKKGGMQAGTCGETLPIICEL